MRFGLLGPLEIASDDGRSVPPGGMRVGMLLAALLLHRGELVPADRLIEELWAADPPDDPRGALQAAASRLRKAIGADRLVSRVGGYAVVVGPGELDADRFEQVAREGRELLYAGEHGEASALLAEALALWRGPALVDFAYESFAQGEIARLEELRLVVLEDRLDADLGAGEHGRLVGELEALVARHPLRERFRAQLMLALYRSGRQADALEAYRSARRTFVDELGIEPGPGLQALERAILAHDPALEVAARPQPAERNAGRERRERQTVLVVPDDLARVGDLLAVAWPLARRPRREVVVAALVGTSSELESAARLLDERRVEMRETGADVRTVAFTSSERAADTVRLAAQEHAALVVVDGPEALLERGEFDPPLRDILTHADADVAILVGELAKEPARPVTVPFGGGEHEWRALEAASWIASAWGTPLSLVGTTADDERGRRDASRLLATASLIAQRAAGVTASPRLARPGATAVAEAAAGSGLLVVGVSSRWEHEGLGAARLALARLGEVPLLLVRRGTGGEQLSGVSDLSRYTWSRGEEPR